MREKISQEGLHLGNCCDQQNNKENNDNRKHDSVPKGAISSGSFNHSPEVGTMRTETGNMVSVNKAHA